MVTVVTQRRRCADRECCMVAPAAPSAGRHLGTVVLLLRVRTVAPPRGCPAERPLSRSRNSARNGRGFSESDERKQGGAEEDDSKSRIADWIVQRKHHKLRRRNHIDDGVAPCAGTNRHGSPAVCCEGYRVRALNTTPGSVRSARRCLPCRHIAVERRRPRRTRLRKQSLRMLLDWSRSQHTSLQRAIAEGTRCLGCEPEQNIESETKRKI